MPYLVGDLIKEITTGGPVPSFPKSFKRPPKLEKEKEKETLDLYDKKLKADQESRVTKSQGEPEEDWVKKKWAWYYELNKMGEMKPNFSKMNVPQFKQYMKDAQAQGRYRVAAASGHIGFRQQPVAQPDSKQKHVEKVVKTEATESVKVKASESMEANAHTRSHPRKKPRVKAHITKEEYLKKH